MFKKTISILQNHLRIDIFAQVQNTMNLKRTIFTIPFIFIANILLAQGGYVKLDIKGGNNTSLGNFASISLKASHCINSSFVIEGGGQYNTAKGFVTELRPSYHHNFKSGRLHIEALTHYAPYSNIHNYAFGGGIGYTARCFWATLGYYHRTIQSSGSSFNEPFNIYYELGISFLPQIAKWDLTISFTNSRIFELERHYQPTFSLDCWWHPNERISTTLGVHYKPAGMFHLTSDYYKFYANIGICYKW